MEELINKIEDLESLLILIRSTSESNESIKLKDVSNSINIILDVVKDIKIVARKLPKN